VTELRSPPERELPDFEAEQEVDFGRYWSAIVARWWLPLAGLIVGAVLGYLVSLGGSDVYQAKATIYLGQPLGPGGSTAVQSLATNPTTVKQIVTARSTINNVAAAAGMRSRELRGHVSTQTVSGAVARLGQNPLVTVTVTGHAPRKVAFAANELAVVVVDEVSTYVRAKVRYLQRQLQAETRELDSIDGRIRALQIAVRPGSSLSTAERLILVNVLGSAEQERRQVVDDQTTTQQQLTFAKNVESAQVVTHAVATKATARSHRNSLLVGAVIGLLLGALAAFVWEPALRLARRPSM
jgi:uncharacterized protein involved in exopolysaccharide biosynthesis